MADDFDMYQGDDVTIYFCVKDAPVAGNPVDISSITDATWVATPAGTTTPTITKHRSDMTIGVDPDEPGATIQNCIFVPIGHGDTGETSDVGQFRHEIRITLNDLQSVIYPRVRETATFSVVESLTWNATANPPAPRITRVESVLEQDPKRMRRDARRNREDIEL